MATRITWKLFKLSKQLSSSQPKLTQQQWAIPKKPQPTPGTHVPQGAASSAAGSSTNANVLRSGLPPLAPFDPLSDQASAGLRWRKWTRRFENLRISLRELDSTVCRGLLLRYVGEATNDIFDTLCDTGTDYATATARLTAHFDPVQNKDMDICDFRQIKQEPEEKAEFPHQDAEILTQVIYHTSDSRICRSCGIHGSKSYFGL